MVVGVRANVSAHTYWFNCHYYISNTEIFRAWSHIQERVRKRLEQVEKKMRWSRETQEWHGELWIPWERVISNRSTTCTLLESSKSPLPMIFSSWLTLKGLWKCFNPSDTWLNWRINSLSLPEIFIIIANKMSFTSIFNSQLTASIKFKTS